METSPLLARRVVPKKERLEKALLVLFLTALLVIGAWIFSGATRDAAPLHLTALAALALAGVCWSAYFWLKKDERARTKEDAVQIRRRIDDDRKGRSWVSRLAYNLKRFSAGVVVLSGIVIALAGLAVFCLQAFGYLKTGAWKPVSTLSVAYPYFPWLRDPQSWFGLHEIISNMLGMLPLSLALVSLGWLVAGFGSALRQRVSG